MFHVIAIYVIFKKVIENEIYKKKHFVFKALQLLILQFQFKKILEGDTCLLRLLL